MADLFVPIAIACAIALVSGLGVVLAPRLVHAVVALLAHSLTLAALYLMLAADLVALAQILIYSGAIVVLFLFVVALLPAGGLEGRAGTGRVLSAVVAAAVLLAALAAGLAAGVPAATAPPVGGVEAVGRSLFGALLVPFELTAPLLLVAIIGAVAIWRRQEPEPRRTMDDGRRTMDDGRTTTDDRRPAADRPPSSIVHRPSSAVQERAP